MVLYQTIHITAILLTGLVAGLFYSYACSVTGALGKLSDREYIKAFQSINNAIQNGWFFASFMGSLFILPVAAWLSYNSGGAGAAFWLLLSATVLYAIAVFGVTMLGNVPLNNMLERFNIHTASSQELLSLRERFEVPWNRLNLIRTVGAIVSFLLPVVSSILSLK